MFGELRKGLVVLPDFFIDWILIVCYLMQETSSVSLLEAANAL